MCVRWREKRTAKEKQPQFCKKINPWGRSNGMARLLGRPVLRKIGMKSVSGGGKVV
jgi:hypothetical protein